MVAGYLREKRGYYHIVLSYTDVDGKRKTPTKSTGLPIKGNKKKAEKMLLEARRERTLELERKRKGIPEVGTSNRDIPFTVFMTEWLEMMKASVEVSTFASYSCSINTRINPYFNKFFPGILLTEITPKHIQDYYTYDMNKNGVSANTVIHRHANIRMPQPFPCPTPRPCDPCERRPFRRTQD